MGGGAQEAGGRVIGLLFGSQNGLDVSIYDAMEVACTAVGADGLELNEALVEKQKDLCELPPPCEYVAVDLQACRCPCPHSPQGDRPCHAVAVMNLVECSRLPLHTHVVYVCVVRQAEAFGLLEMIC